ncbi:MAG TPA: hypothetical protein VHJ20_08295 [Polyangia bacterium]|nr:hypothetical protein [Polyangia bacterium]
MKTSLMIALLVGGGVLAAGPRVSAEEPAACHAVPEAETHLAVLMSKDDVLRVDALDGRQHIDDPTAPIGSGARMWISAQPFVTATWFQTVINCHLAEVAAHGAPKSAQPLPIDVPGARTIVSYQPGVLRVDVTSKDAKAAAEILARARALAPASTPSAPTASR